jgi:uncharacterized protein (DUF2141 family)
VKLLVKICNNFGHTLELIIVNTDLGYEKRTLPTFEDYCLSVVKREAIVSNNTFYSLKPGAYAVMSISQIS